MKAETLKKAILQYAMQGKLVEQDPNDEPASVLLERIKAEKEQLIKDGKIKKEKPLLPISEDENSFELPKGWGFARLGSIIEIARGGSPRPIQDYLTNSPDGLNWIKIGDSDKGGKYINSTKEKITKEGLNKTRFVRKGNFLLSNSMSFGRPYILNIDGCIHDGWLVLSNIEKCFNKDFLYYLLSSYYIYQQFCGSVSGAVVKNLNTDKVSNAVVCIPPLAEQERIVERLEQILPLVEEYGKNEEKLSKLNSTLPEKIKQSILQHAVQGKLVPQNPNDEPASELLNRIKAEKEQLIKDGKIKKEKPLPPITDDEIPYELPKGWEWVRLRDICEILNGYAFKSDSYVTKSNNQIIRLGNVKNNGLALETSPVYIPDTIAKNAVNYLLKENDILITLTGTRLKRDYFYTALVKRNDIEQFNLYLNQRVGCLRFYSDVNPKLLNIFLKSKLILDNIFEHETGTANQGNIGTGATGELLIPLPPLAEQHRIVTKVEELLAIVDKIH